ncbi:MAG: class I SAM-dependent methyltransferase, partial [Spirochaetota bacterium]
GFPMTSPRKNNELSHSERHGRLFHRIALPYSWFFAGQSRRYARCFELGRCALPDPAGKQALDLGCGTGAFTDALRRAGWSAQGVDIAPGMLAQAHKKGLSCALGDVLQGLALADHSFDLVSAAYLAHGLLKDDRLRLFTEMRRLSRGLVLLHDYTPNRHPLTSLIEYLEGGDYFNFIQTGEAEMRAVFTNVDVVKVGPRAAWYICRVD